eukprot:gene10889-13339_t
MFDLDMVTGSFSVICAYREPGSFNNYTHKINRSIKWLPRLLPKNISELKIRENVEFQFDEEGVSFPSTLKILDIDSTVKIQLKPGMIPMSVEKLILPDSSYEFITGVVPPSVKTMVFRGPLDRIGPFRTSNGLFESIIPVGFIPTSVKDLSFEGSFSMAFRVGVIPDSVTSLRFEGIFSGDF